MYIVLNLMIGVKRCCLCMGVFGVIFFVAREFVRKKEKRQGSLFVE
jgi:hypothetical protein